MNKIYRKLLIVTMSAAMAVSMVACGDTTAEEVVDEVVTASDSTTPVKAEDRVKSDSKTRDKATATKKDEVKKDNNKKADDTDKAAEKNLTVKDAIDYLSKNA